MLDLSYVRVSACPRMRRPQTHTLLESSSADTKVLLPSSARQFLVYQVMDFFLFPSNQPLFVN